MTGEHTIGDGPIEEKYREQMKELARAIDAYLNPTLPGVPSGNKQAGFVLLVFPFEGHEGRCNYMSNAMREDIVVLLKEQLRRFEGQPEVSGTA